MNPSQITILIDNGHGVNTPGKCSPDKRLREYAWARAVAKRLKDELSKAGINAVLITPEENDISLTERTRRVNNICAQKGANNCALVSIHNNAMGADGKWHSASGWSGWVAPNASAKSKKLAQLLYAEAEKRGLKGNRAVPAGKFWIGNFAIVRDTKCPAVLTENLFQDNKSEVEYLLSEKGINEIVQIHKDGLLNYIKQL